MEGMRSKERRGGEGKRVPFRLQPGTTPRLPWDTYSAGEEQDDGQYILRDKAEGKGEERGRKRGRERGKEEKKELYVLPWFI